MTTKLGITALAALTTAIADSATAIGAVFADGKVDLKDFTRIPAILEAGREYTLVQFEELIPEIGDLDEAEVTTLHKVFVEKFNLPADDDVESTIEAGLEIVIEAVQAGQQMWDVVKKIRDQVASKIA